MTEGIVSLATVIITLICGVVAKKSPWVNNHLIPVQNIVTGLVIAIIYYVATEDISVAIATSGILAGGVYDIANNLNKIAKGE